MGWGRKRIRPRDLVAEWNLLFRSCRVAMIESFCFYFTRATRERKSTFRPLEMAHATARALNWLGSSAGIGLIGADETALCTCMDSRRCQLSAFSAFLLCLGAYLTGWQ